jgi:signal peptidase I
MRRVLGWLTTAIVLGILAGWFVWLRPANLGGPIDYVIVRGSSMLPTLETGDLVIVRQRTEYAVGDVVAYHVPRGEVGEGLLVIHRITGRAPDGRWILQGDNNDAIDPWMPSTADMAGGIWVHLPKVGHVLAEVHQPVVLGAIAAALVVMAMVWRQSPSESATKRRTRPLRPEDAASSRIALE